MDQRFKGRVALVTGGARGIGRAVAERFAEDGATVVVCDLDKAAVDEAARGIADQYKGTTLGFACDVSKRAEVESMMDALVAQAGRLDILVNNAGVTRDNLIHKMTDDDWDGVMAVHLRGTFLCSQAAQKAMVKNQYGRIVNISSTSALGNRGQVNYSAAKAGPQGFTRTLALELGRFGITVNAVAPGFIDTEMTRKSAERRGLDPEEYKAERAKGIPVQRVGVPRDVANLVCFLASDEASFVSGQIVYVSGGPETRR